MINDPSVLAATSFYSCRRGDVSNAAKGNSINTSMQSVPIAKCTMVRTR